MSTVSPANLTLRLPAAYATIAGWAGLASAVILLINAAKRAGLIPTVSATQLIAPLGEVLAIIFITGLYAAAQRRGSAWGLAAYVANISSLALLVGVEFVINLVLAGRAEAEVAELLSAPLKAALTVTSMLFLVSSIAFAAALWTDRSIARWALVAYALGASVVALRAFIPEWALDAGLVVLGLGVAALAAGLLGSMGAARREVAQADSLVG